MYMNVYVCKACFDVNCCLPYCDWCEGGLFCSQLHTQHLPWCLAHSELSVQSSVVTDSATPWTAAHQASLSITNSRSLPTLMSIESGVPPSHLILCRPLPLPPSSVPSISVFSNESALCIRWPKYWSFSISASVLPMNTQD